MGRPNAALACFCLTLVTMALWAYLPGLHGNFIFDDYANLPALGNYGPVVSWGVFWRYITSGQADPTGRPLALLSFLIDARDWPAPAYPFKRTNLLIHLTNAALLGLLLYRLGRFAQQGPGQDLPQVRARAKFAAALGSAFWLLHPLFVSTTLYIVQREAMLPATFTLLGLLLWLGGRERLWRGKTRIGLVCMAAGLLGCTGLAVLSKANGILLPALALVVEYTLLRPIDDAVLGTQPARELHVRAQRQNRLALAVLAWPATALVASYLIWEGWRGWHADISSLRPWTLPQRLLTEPRVLFDYLELLWVPRPFTPGVFNDQIVASRSLLHPGSTLFAMLGLLLLAAGAWRLRRRWPAFALAVIFYLVGQALESSTIALELFFEHRNYLPSMLMFWPLALWLCDVKCGRPAVDATGPKQAPPVSATNVHEGRAKIALALVLLAGLALMTHARATLWGNNRDQAALWATLNPASPRAQAYAAQMEMNAGNPQAAARRLEQALSRSPDDPSLALNLLAARCQSGHLDAAALDVASRALANSRDSGSLLASWFQRVIAESQHPVCPELGSKAIGRLLQAARANALLDANPGRRQDLLSLQGQLELANGNAPGALAYFEQALDVQVSATTAFKQAALLGSAGHPTEALAELDHYQANRKYEATPDSGMPRLHAWVLHRQHYWEIELAHLRNTLIADERAQGSNKR